MLPYWRETVTLFHRTIASNGEVSWSKRYCYNCFIKFANAVEREDGHATQEGYSLCRFSAVIPNIATGDIVAKGKLTDTIDEYTDGSRSSDFLESHNGTAFSVVGIRTNDEYGAPLQHTFVEGA